MASRLDLDLLKTFVAVAEIGNLTKAGERLLISQPTVSLQLKRLEDGLGRRLMERSARGVQLTADGEAMVFHDFELDRLTLGSGRVDALNAAELAGLSMRGTGDRKRYCERR